MRNIFIGDADLNLFKDIHLDILRDDENRSILHGSNVYQHRYLLGIRIAGQIFEMDIVLLLDNRDFFS